MGAAYADAIEAASPQAKQSACSGGDDAGVLEDFGHGVVGFGDEASFGLTQEVRELVGTEENVDYCNPAYGQGAMVAMVWPVGLGKLRLADDAFALAVKGGTLDRLAVRLADETGAIGRYGNLGNLSSRADETVADVIRSRGGGASQVRQLQTGHGELTLGEISELAASGDRQAVRTLKMVKQAGSPGKGGR